MKSLCMIACVSRNLGIGKDSDLLFRIPEDMKFFKETTLGCPVIMGGATYRSIGRALPGRENIVLTRSRVEEDGVKSFSDLNELKKYLQELDSDVYVIGGASMYQEFLPEADVLYLTEVDSEPEADTFFPEFKRDEYEAEMIKGGKHDGLVYCIMKYSRGAKK